MAIEKVALIGVYLSPLWFIPLIYLYKKPLERKIGLIKTLSFIPIMGSYLFIITAAIKLFMDQEYIAYEINHYNVLFVLFLLLQIVTPYLLDFSLTFYKKSFKKHSVEEKKEYIVYFILTVLFSVDTLMRYEIYRLTF